MVRQLARVVGVGIETADMLVHEVLSRPMRDRRAVARYAGLTGAPDESGAKRREQGLARAGNARVRRGMVQLAWRFLLFQKESALARWYRARTADSRLGTRKTFYRNSVTNGGFDELTVGDEVRFVAQHSESADPHGEHRSPARQTSPAGDRSGPRVIRRTG